MVLAMLSMTVALTHMAMAMVLLALALRLCITTTVPATGWELAAVLLVMGK
jgi:hypothetical protein